MENMDMRALLRLLWEKALWLVLGLVVGLLLMFGYTQFLVKPTYTTQVTFYCIGVPGTVSSSELNSRSSLAVTYADVIRGDQVLDVVAEALGGDMTSGQLTRMMSTAANGETGVLTIAMTSNDPQLSVHACRYVAELAPEVLNQITGGGKLNLVDDKTDETPAPYVPMTRNVALGALGGLLVAALIVILRDVMDNTVSDAQRMRQRLDVPILGEIPEFAASAQKRGYVYGRVK